MDTMELQKIKNRYDIVGNDAALDRALETAIGVAATDLTVMIIGESGVGKDAIPRLIHDNSLRKQGPYFAVNCGAIPEGTIDSELFGHEKGSFTGAISTRNGYFEEANGGTLFLDEIGELPLSSQAKLLRVIQNHEFIKVGSSKVEKTNVRVIAATNVNLFHAVSQGKFRLDLYYRLAGIQIRMPAVRDRQQDIELLFKKFSSDFAEKYNVCSLRLAPSAKMLLLNYRWPGNVRQLKNVAEVVTAMESKPRTRDCSIVEINGAALEKYMPHEPEEVGVVPVDSSASSLGGNESVYSTERNMIFSSLNILSVEIANLKKEIEFLKTDKQVPALPPSGPDDQGYIGDVAVVEQPDNTHGDSQDIDDQKSYEDVEETKKTISLQDAEKMAVEAALKESNGNRKLAAQQLGCSERNLYRLIQKYGF